jgi:CDP-diacylglycerol--serine O-phosphatidyltransferase
MVILTYFVICGVSRLARFNVTASALADAETGKVKYFEGTPIPTSLLLVAILAVLLALGKSHADLPFGAYRIGYELHPLVLMYFVSGSAMMSKTLRLPKI